MKSTTNHGRSQCQPQWQKARSRTSSELLAILAPSAEEPEAIQRSAFWKTGTLAVPQPEEAA